MNNIQGVEDKIRGGILYPFELEIPFVPKRIFWIVNVPANSIRGRHAHKSCQQFYVCIKGYIEVTMIEGSSDSVKQVMMVRGNTLFVDRLLWTKERFITEDSILLVLCSNHYDKNDYIYTVEELKEYIKNG